MDLKNFISERKLQKVLDTAKKILPEEKRNAANDSRPVTNVATEKELSDARVKKMKPTQYVRVKKAEKLKKAEELAKLKAEEAEKQAKLKAEKKIKREEMKKLKKEAEDKYEAKKKQDENYEKFKSNARTAGLGLGTLGLGKMILDDDDD